MIYESFDIYLFATLTIFNPRWAADDEVESKMRAQQLLHAISNNRI